MLRFNEFVGSDHEGSPLKHVRPDTLKSLNINKSLSSLKSLHDDKESENQEQQVYSNRDFENPVEIEQDDQNDNIKQ